MKNKIIGSSVTLVKSFVKKARNLTLLAALAAIGTGTLPAGIILLAGGGPNIAANSITNFAALAQVGTFSLSPQYLYFNTQNGLASTNGVTALGRLTFDGTNFFVLPQVWTNPQTNPLSNVPWQVTNVVIPVYAALTISNNTAQVISNFNASLQF